MAAGFDRLTYRSEQGVATLTLARPEKRNALDLRAFDKLGRAAAMAAAAELAAAAPLPVRHVKVLVDRAAGSGIEASMERERQAQAVCLGSDDAAEALAASLERRPPASPAAEAPPTAG
jgi:enoyl-CoA hydratase/carnithine racemase